MKITMNTEEIQEAMTDWLTKHLGIDENHAVRYVTRANWYSDFEFEVKSKAQFEKEDREMEEYRAKEEESSDEQLCCTA